MYDIIGDVHGCYEELVLLLEKLGYVAEGNPCKSPMTHPEGRKAVSVGDLGDRGPNSPGCFAVFRQMVRADTAICLQGNHDDKLRRFLKGNNVKVGNGMQKTIDQLHSKSSPIKKKTLYKFLDGLPYRVMLDDNKLLVCHAGLKEKYHYASMNRKIVAKCIYGETTGAKDADGYPVRLPWQDDYSGVRVVVHGHVALPEVSIVNNVYDVDTSCVFGGKLTALRYPEMELVSQPALKTYEERKTGIPFGTNIEKLDASKVLSAVIQPLPGEKDV
jgi:protein phosphatase